MRKNYEPETKNQQADYGIFCEGDQLEAYQFIQSYHETFGTRWLLRKFNICPIMHLPAIVNLWE